MSKCFVAKNTPVNSRSISNQGKAVKRIARGVYWSAVSVVLLATIVAAFGLDRFTLLMPFTFSPRIAWVGLSSLVGVWAAFRRNRMVAVLMLGMAIFNLAISPLGLGEKHQSPDDLTILSFNTHNPVNRINEFVEFCGSTNADVVCLQEIQPDDRQSYIQALPEYQFFAPDPSAEFEHKDRWSFSCLTGFRRELLADPKSVRTSTGITGYRTFAVRAELDSGPICVVNVHSTKPVTLRHGFTYFFLDAISKAHRHQKEHRLLADWLSQVDDVPVIVAGDFNAPSGSNSLRFPGFRSAQRIAGSGLHLTFPAKFPVYGIDHILGNKRIGFTSCRRINTGLSDHLAQLATFGFEG